jgi:hypothetical protein
VLETRRRTFSVMGYSSPDATAPHEARCALVAMATLSYSVYLVFVALTTEPVVAVILVTALLTAASFVVYRGFVFEN